MKELVGTEWSRRNQEARRHQGRSLRGVGIADVRITIDTWKHYDNYNTTREGNRGDNLELTV